VITQVLKVIKSGLKLLQGGLNVGWRATEPPRSETDRGAEVTATIAPPMRPRHCTDGGELHGELRARPISYSTWAERHSFVNSCHGLPLIFRAICALLSCNGMTVPGTWMLRTDSEAPHKSETQHCSMLGSVDSMTGYTCSPGIVNRLRALYLVAEYSTHAVQMVT
jgi:hypothetical protein